MTSISIHISQNIYKSHISIWYGLVEYVTGGGKPNVVIIIQKGPLRAYIELLEADGYKKQRLIPLQKIDKIETNEMNLYIVKGDKNDKDK